MRISHLLLLVFMQVPCGSVGKSCKEVALFKSRFGISATNKIKDHFMCIKSSSYFLPRRVNMKRP